jgi:hypothetical protein
MKRLFPLVIALVAAGCSIEQKPRALHTEGAVVEQVVFSPGHDCSGLGFSSSGETVFNDCSTEDVYAVVFRCQHGKFVVKHGDKAMRR